ncbi:CLUMA_CG018927, isoform A [Clunio marinus]|uniref:CLUMA_CG018927, isoform A n=1 Tax=Clunio marinus TaxID=568069 RepID=A0A1J1J175_9DIPT|nr:CLUMA_CG018927, isoform A [Clunio marinus]
MGNTNSMNNMSMLDQKRYQAEFLRYSQIPYESQYHQQQSIHASNMNLHQFNKYKEAVANPVKVLPDVKFEPKLRTTNNGAILHSGGTISGRKDSDCGLHRSKSISETQNTYLSNPNGMPAPPPQFRMQRASTQLSINLNQPLRVNLNKNFGSTHDLKSADNKSVEKRQQEKPREVKKGRAPPPPVTNQNNNRIRMTPPPTTQAPDPPLSKTKAKVPMGQRLFGDTLTKNHQNAVRSIQQQQPNERVSPMKPKAEMNRPTVSKIIPSPTKPTQMLKVNPTSYLRRERTFDVTLMQNENREKFRPNFSPQFQRKQMNESSKPVELRQMSTQERYRASVATNRSSAVPQQFKSELQSATKIRRSLAGTNAEKMRTIDKKPLKKPSPAIEKPTLEHKKSSDNSAISNPTVSASSSFKFSNPKQYNAKEPEIVQYHRHGEEILPSNDAKESNVKDENQDANNFYFGMQEASVDTDNEDEINEAEQAQMEAINRFAEDIFKMSSRGSNYMPNSQVSPESVISDRECDSDSDILLSLRPTLPRRQLQIPRFSPVAAWKSLLVDTNLTEAKNNKTNSSLLQLHVAVDDQRQETKIERIYREPSFNLQQLDNKSGDSGISADKEIGGNSPDSQMPQAYLILQKFRKTVADAFGSITNVNDNKIQIQNYGVDSNWLLSSQPNSIDEFAQRKEGERTQIISQMTSGKHVMYLPTNFEDDPKFETTVRLSSVERETSPTYKNHDDDEEQFQTKLKSKNHKFKFQSTIRQVERRKIAEKLSREAEEKEMRRLSELEAMQKVEEEFQRKRAREKNMIRHQLRIASLEESYESQHDHVGRSNYYNGKNYNEHDEDETDTRTPYISRIIEAKSPKVISSQYKS